ncbi:MAG: hypothetical protein ACJAVT_000565 [Yoonia sp.]|jgi:hypothetical protein
MAKASKLDRLSDQVITALLEKHACPLPFHAVRAVFMGNIATPDMTASPMQAIRDLWGGELPEFETKQDAELLMMGLMQGLWNGLSAYQNRTNPFKLTRVKSHQPSWEVLARLSLLRREEIDGFIEGLFAGHEEIDLPEKAHRATNILGEIGAMLVGLHGLATKNNTTPTDIKELDGMIKQVRELSIIAEKDMNVAIQSCKRARAQMLETYVAEKPVLH